MAAARAGLKREGEQLLAWTRHLRDDDGSYWTGCVHPGCKRYPSGQKSTYSAAAVVIADHVLYGRSSAAEIFSVNGPVEGPVDWPVDGVQAAGSPSDWTAALSSPPARLPEPMHDGTPTPP